MADGQSRRSALIALGLLTLIWSYNWIVMKQALRYIGPFDFSAIRYALGTAVLFALLLRRDSLRPPPWLPLVAVIGLAQTTGFQALVQWALVSGGAGQTALLAYTMPFWVLLLGWGLLSEKVSQLQAVGLIVAAVGLLLILEPWLGFGGAFSTALALAGGFCWALGTVLSKWLFQRKQVSVLSLTAWQMLFGCLGLIVLAGLVPEQPIEWSGYLIGAVIYNGLLSSGLAWLLWLMAVQRLPAHVAGLSSLAIPVLSVAFAWALLGERPSAAVVGGIVCICAALLVINWRPKRP
ncbi:MAG TPA: DMT family transporter [Rhodanobacteraceae bacterium]|nr:DMT family transporter [Rhodanobacteraceae bacterium]